MNNLVTIFAYKANVLPKILVQILVNVLSFSELVNAAPIRFSNLLLQYPFGSYNFFKCWCKSVYTVCCFIKKFIILI